MLIDWFTVGAQALNFIVLVWLLKRFLYKPILQAVDAREKRIAKELADARAKMAEAEKLRDEFEHKNIEFGSQRATLLGKATDEATSERRRLLEDARKGGRMPRAPSARRCYRPKRAISVRPSAAAPSKKSSRSRARPDSTISRRPVWKSAWWKCSFAD